MFNRSELRFQFGHDRIRPLKTPIQWLIARYDRFQTVTLDFTGVQSIGQAFAYGLYWVNVSAHPQVELRPMLMTQQVERMWLRAVAFKGWQTID